MPRICIHLAGNDLQQKTAQVYGGANVEKAKPQSVICPKCKLTDHPTNECCGRCGSVLDASRIADLEQKDLQTSAQLTAMQNELDQLLEMLRRHGLGREVRAEDTNAQEERGTSPALKPSLHNVLTTEEQFSKWQETSRQKHLRRSHRIQAFAVAERTRAGLLACFFASNYLAECYMPKQPPKE